MPPPWKAPSILYRGRAMFAMGRRRHVMEPFEVPAEWERLGGLDFGFNNPTAGASQAKSPDGVYYWYGEHYKREATLAVHAALLKAPPPYGNGVGGDAFGWKGDPSAKQQMLELRRLGITVTPGDNDVRAGIDTVYTLLAEDRLRIFVTCRHGLDELEGYTWKSDPYGFRDEPVKQRDHLMDAVRYALHGAERGPRMQVWV